MSKTHDQIREHLQMHPYFGVTLTEIAWYLRNQHGNHVTTPTISARIRDLRKEKYGKHNVVRKKVGKLQYYSIPKESNEP